MRGAPDRPTPINLAHHAYFNLGGGGTVKDHVLWVDAEAYTPLDAELIPTGAIAPVEGTPLDFREPREIGDTAIDNNFVLREGRDPAAPAASASCPRTELRLRVWTDQPGLQVFDAPTMTVGAPGHEGETYGPFAGLCFEAQHFPEFDEPSGLAEHRAVAGDALCPAVRGGDRSAGVSHPTECITLIHASTR